VKVDVAIPYIRYRTPNDDPSRKNHFQLNASFEERYSHGCILYNQADSYDTAILIRRTSPSISRRSHANDGMMNRWSCMRDGS
jgi:hypothetical protein